MGVCILTTLILRHNRTALMLKSIPVLFVPVFPECLWADEKCGTPPRMLGCELEDVPAWVFEVVALGEVTNLYCVGRKMCRYLGRRKGKFALGAVCRSLLASPPLTQQDISYCCVLCVISKLGLFR